MQAFDDRKKANETKFVRDAAKEFKAEARRNKMLGAWAAELMNIEGDAAEKYVLSVIASDMEEAGDEDVFRKLRGDLDAAGVELSDAALRDKMATCLAEARESIYGEG